MIDPSTWWTLELDWKLYQLEENTVDNIEDSYRYLLNYETLLDWSNVVD